MPYACPHCDQPTISYLAKWWSGSIVPARCAACGRLCHVRSSTARQSSASGLAVAGIGVMAFVRWPHPAVLVSGLLLAACVYLLAYHWVRLEPTDDPGLKLLQSLPITVFGVVLLIIAWAGRNA